MDVIDIGVVATPMVYFATLPLRDRQRRDGHGQPQPARVQRPEDDGRGDTLAASDPGAARASSGRCSPGSRQVETPTSPTAYLDRIVPPT
jgi:hypothetical protein